MTPSIWFCGIEWGGSESRTEQGIYETIRVPVVAPPGGFENVDDNFAYIFNWQALKLLAVIHGFRVDQYKEFGYKYQPFVEGGSGFFKMNLFPFAFKNTSHEHWLQGVSKATGFTTKQEYIDWVRVNRLPLIRSWTRKYGPKLVVCVGLTYADDFRSSFGDASEFTSETIEGKILQWVKNSDGALVVVIPFMVNRNGLTRNVAIQAVGERIRALLD